MCGSIIETRKKSFSKDRQFRRFVFTADTEENPVLQRYDDVNGINIFKVSVTTSGHSFLRANQNVSNYSEKIIM
jgi:hypothetical protein